MFQLKLSEKNGIIFKKKVENISIINQKVN